MGFGPAAPPFQLPVLPAGKEQWVGEIQVEDEIRKTNTNVGLSLKHLTVSWRISVEGSKIKGQKHNGLLIQSHEIEDH